MSCSANNPIALYGIISIDLVKRPIEFLIYNLAQKLCSHTQKVLLKLKQLCIKIKIFILHHQQHFLFVEWLMYIYIKVTTTNTPSRRVTLLFLMLASRKLCDDTKKSGFFLSYLNMTSMRQMPVFSLCANKRDIWR